LILHGLTVYLAYLVANVQSRLSMDHAAVHDSRDDTSAVLSHFQGDAHRLVGIFLELNKSDARDMLKLAAVICYVVDLITPIEIGL